MRVTPTTDAGWRLRCADAFRMDDEEMVDLWIEFILDTHDRSYKLRIQDEVERDSTAAAWTHLAPKNGFELESVGSELPAFARWHDPSGRKSVYSYGPVQDAGYRSVEVNPQPGSNSETRITLSEAPHFERLPGLLNPALLAGIGITLTTGYFRSIEFASELRKKRLLVASSMQGHDLSHLKGYGHFGPTLWGLLINQSERVLPLLSNSDFFEFRHYKHSGEGQKMHPLLFFVKGIAHTADRLSEYFSREASLLENLRLENFTAATLSNCGLANTVDADLAKQICQEAHERRKVLQENTHLYVVNHGVIDQVRGAWEDIKQTCDRYSRAADYEAILNDHLGTNLATPFIPLEATLRTPRAAQASDLTLGVAAF
jgi:hypothetical protein